MTKNKLIVAFEQSSLKCCKEKCEECFCNFENSYCNSKCSPKYFKELKKYCIDENLNAGFEYSDKNRVININKYTGIIELNDGTYLEILPKINQNIDESRQIFENLLRASLNLTKEYKENKETGNKPQKYNHILEIIISLFCEHLKIILSKGIKKTYIKQQENLHKYKGKIVFNKHINKNCANNSRFYVEFSELNIDIAENRLLKTACLFLINKTTSENNKKILARFLVEMDNVSRCYNLEKDLSEVNINRLNVYYEKPIQYAVFFLRQQMFYPRKGKSKLPSLLFPLNEMFEDYIENLLKTNKIKYQPQFSTYYLIKKLNNKDNIFQTRMDFVIFDGYSNSNKKPTKALIIDAKWKIINASKDKLDIEQNDLYQLFTYSEIMKNAGIKEVKIALLYPQTQYFEENIINGTYFNNMNISIVPINVLNPQKNKAFIDLLKTFKISQYTN